jgi:hypothetical protein
VAETSSDGHVNADTDTQQKKGEEEKPSEFDPLRHLLQQFEARIEGLIELLEALSPHVAALDRPDAIGRVIDEAGFSDSGKALAKAVFVPETEKDKAEEAEGHAPEAESESGPADDTSAKDDGIELPAGTNGQQGETELVPEEQAGKVIESALETLLKREPAALLKIFRRLARSGLAPREELLNGSLLTVVVAAFESLLAGLYREHLVLHPNQLASQDKEFSLKDLLEFGSLDDARRDLIERRTDSFMRKGFDDWSRWSEKTLGMGFDELSLNPRIIEEVFQRRHLIVHTGGIVTQLYLDRVECGSDPPPKLGSEIHVSVDYLRAALDEVLVLGIALASVATSKWVKEDGGNEAAGRLTTSTYDLMKEGRWPLAKRLCEVGLGLGQTHAGVCIVKVNGWLAARALGEADACAEEIEDWDVSALEPKFRLAKAALQGDADRVMEWLPTTLESMGVEAAMVPGWPLLDPYRNDDRFKKIVDDAGVSVAAIAASTEER